MKADIASITMAGLLLLLAGPVHAVETCTTQSQMQASERDPLVLAALTMAGKIQTDDEAGLRTLTIADFQKDFTGIAATIAATAPKVKGSEASVEQVYLLDASSLKRAVDGSNPDAQFFCTLNKSANEAEFSIPQLPPGRYGFVMVRMEAATPWRLSFLLRDDGGRWLLAGFYPKALTADGHDGLWYWKQARTLVSSGQPWSGWLYLQEAQALIAPAAFISSTHLDKLQSELTAATPPAVSGGVSADAPLVVRGQVGTDFRFTGITTDDSLGHLDVAAHLKIDSLGDAAGARKRNLDAMSALVAAHPEFRKTFHGVWIFAEAPGQSPYATELAMSEIP